MIKTSLKRGVVDACFGGCKLENNNVKWFYNYNPINYRNIPSTVSEFIPMIKNRDYLNKAITYNVFKPAILLSINEPDIPNGPNAMTFDEALSVHKGIEDNIQPVLLSSPAITKMYGVPWLKQFIAGNGIYVPRVDFIAIHWYDLDPYKFLQYVDDVYKTFNKPIWVTEFSLADWKLNNPQLTEENNVKRFMDITMTGLENRPFVQRYAWFSSTTNSAISKCSLWDINTKDLTTLGKYYFGISS